jgi:putative tryptophan/tyrosine transport system substrate-binding protein
MTHPSIGLLVTIALTILVAPLTIAAPPSGNVPRIGVLSPFSPATGQATGDSLGQEMVDAFRQGLQALGYLEGQTLRLEYRWAEGHPERLAELAADLARLPVDILVTISMAGVRAAQQATATIPIVSGGAGDLVRGGLVASLAQPGGNITGVTDINPELNGKQLELLKAVVPGIAPVGFLSDALADPHTAALHWQELQAAAHPLALQLQLVAVREAEDLEGAFTTPDEAGCRCAGHGAVRLHAASPPSDRGARGPTSPAGDVSRPSVCGGWGPYVLWEGPSPPRAPRRQLCG